MLPTFKTDPTPIPPPAGPPAPALDPGERLARALAWAHEIERAVRANDAWGLLLQRPDMDLRLVGVGPARTISPELLTWNASACYLVTATPGWDR